MLYLPHAMAQTNSTSSSAAPSGNSSSSTTNATSAQEPAAGQSFVWQGTKSSQADPLSGHTKEQVTAILLPRSDKGVYSGVLTYSASKPVNVEVWHIFSPGNKTAIPTKTFGDMKAADYQGKGYAISDISPTGASGSVPFSGNVLLLHATSPFTVTYTVNAVAQPAKQVNGIESAMALAAPPAPTKQTLTSGSVGSSSGSGSSSSGGSGSGSSSSGGSGSGSSSSGHSSHHGHSSKSSSTPTPALPLT
jgi:uncharacterized membrane protein YgcG